MKIVTNSAEKIELRLLKPGDVFSHCDSEYWIVSTIREGSRINILRLSDGLLVNEVGITKVTPLPDACLKV